MPASSPSVDAELVALDVQHRDARIVAVVQRLHVYRAERDQPCAFGLKCGEALFAHEPGADPHTGRTCRRSPTSPAPSQSPLGSRKTSSSRAATGAGRPQRARRYRDSQRTFAMSTGSGRPAHSNSQPTARQACPVARACNAAASPPTAGEQDHCVHRTRPANRNRRRPAHARSANSRCLLAADSHGAARVQPDAVSGPTGHPESNVRRQPQAPSRCRDLRLHPKRSGRGLTPSPRPATKLDRRLPKVMFGAVRLRPASGRGRAAGRSRRRDGSAPC